MLVIYAIQGYGNQFITEDKLGASVVPQLCVRESTFQEYELWLRNEKLLFWFVRLSARSQPCHG